MGKSAKNQYETKSNEIHKLLFELCRSVEEGCQRLERSWTSKEIYCFIKKKCFKRFSLPYQKSFSSK